MENVARTNRDLPTTSGRIDDVLGDGITCGVSAQRFDDLQPLGHTGAEMG